jgi:hypothetical protein
VSHFVERGRALFDIERVVFIPLANETAYPEAGDGLDAELVRAVQCRRLFRLEPAPPEALGAAAGGKAVTLRELAAIRSAVNSDAVLLGAVTHFRPPPHMQIGLYLRLLDLRQGRVLWTVDYLWDAASRDTQERIAVFYSCYMAESGSPLQWQMATVSPKMFQKFVAWEVAQTLPGRPAPGSEDPWVVAVADGTEEGTPAPEKSSQVPPICTDNIESEGETREVHHEH